MYSSILLKKILKTRFLNIRHSYLCFIVFLIGNGQAFSQMTCSFIPDNNMPTNAPPNFISNGHKCLKIKFHFLNNTSGPKEQISSQFFLDILARLNRDFEKYDISFTPDNICPHLGPENLLTQATTLSNIASIFTGGNPPPSEFQHDPNSLNLYFFQQDIIPSSSAVGNYSNVRRGQLDDFTHEVGHFLGLRHTFDNAHEIQIVNGVPTSVEVYECKDRNNVNGQGVKTCLLRGDRICDTGSDPHELYQGVSFQGANCLSLNLPLVDGCGDNTTPWDVPVTNWMSYYYVGSTCKLEFSKDQTSLMQSNLETSLANFTVPCNNNDPACNDIIINSSESWPNALFSNIVRLCQSQKIIITPTGSLTLTGVTITKKLNSNNECPDFSGNWDGIYIDPAAYGSAQYPGGPASPTGGKLNVTQNSIIEYSENGIQASGSHNGITISNSILSNNGMAIYSKGPGGLVASGSVNVTSSTITSSGFSKPVLIRMDGSNLTIQSTSTITNLGGSGITGIKSFNGRLTVKNSTIKDFGVGIDKELNGGIGIGLVLNGNHILGNLTSVRNTSSGVTATKNFFQGKIQQFGKAYGRWYSNNFRKEVILDNPSLSYAFIENQFDGSRLDFSKNQSLTDARCNIWKNTGTACDGKPTSIKPSWGSQPISSGNKHDGSMPYMGIDLGNQIIHYHRNSDQFTIFTYDGTYFTGSGANVANPDCQYNLFPTEFTGGGGSSEESYNNTSNTQYWQGLNQQLSTLESQLGSTTGTALQNLINQIADVKVAIGQSVLTALQNIDPLDSTTSYNIWVSRADDIVAQQVMMVGYWNTVNFSDLITYVNSLSLSGEENQDRANLLKGLDTLISFQSQARNITGLTEEDLDVLINIASSSFGSYTALLRAWLNIQYNIRIDPPIELNSYSRKYSMPNFNGKSETILVPNPTSDCIELVWRGIKPSIQIVITDLTGKIRFSKIVVKNNPICLKDLLGSGLFFLQIPSSNSSSVFETKKLIIE